MSKKSCKKEFNTCCDEGLNGRKPTLPSLVILILILLQFGCGNLPGVGNFNGIDNGILFIIALFYLSCCNPCKSNC